MAQQDTSAILTIKEVKKYIILTLIGVILTSSAVPVTFYFKTKYTLEEHTSQINEIKDEVKGLRANITAVMITPAENMAEVKAIKIMMQNIIENQKTLSDNQKELQGRVDDIYKILLEKR